MAIFNKELGGAQVTSGVIQGVEDNSMTNLIGGLGKVAIEKKQESLLEDFGSGATDVFSVLDQGASFEADESLTFGKKMEKYKQMAKASGKEDEFKLRAEAYLKGKIAERPGMADLYRKKASSVFGGDYSGESLRQKIASTKSTAADYQKKLDDMDNDYVKNYGGLSGDLNKPEHQARYQKLKSLERDHIDLKHLADLAKVRKDLREDGDTGLQDKEREAKIASANNTIFNYKKNVSEYKYDVGRRAVTDSRSDTKFGQAQQKYQDYREDRVSTSIDKAQGAADKNLVRNYWNQSYKIGKLSTTNARSARINWFISNNIVRANEVEEKGMITSEMINRLSNEQRQQFSVAMKGAASESYQQKFNNYGYGIGKEAQRDMEKRHFDGWDAFSEVDTDDEKIKRMENKHKLDMLILTDEMMSDPEGRRQMNAAALGEKFKLPFSLTDKAELSKAVVNAMDAIMPLKPKLNGEFDMSTSNVEELNKEDTKQLTSWLLDAAEGAGTEGGASNESVGKVFTNLAKMFTEDGANPKHESVRQLLIAVKDPAQEKVMNKLLQSKPELREELTKVATQHLNNLFINAGKTLKGFENGGFSGLFGQKTGKGSGLSKFIEPVIKDGRLMFDVIQDVEGYDRGSLVQDVKTKTGLAVSSANIGLSALVRLVGENNADVMTQALKGTPWEGLDLSMEGQKKRAGVTPYIPGQKKTRSFYDQSGQRVPDNEAPNMPSATKKKPKIRESNRAFMEWGESKGKDSLGLGLIKAWDKANKKYKLSDKIANAANKHNVDAELVKTLMGFESAFNPHAVSKTGARGLTQFQKGAQRKYNVKFGTSDKAIKSQVDGAAAYLSDAIKEYNGDIVMAVLSYNQGSGNVRRYLKGDLVTGRKVKGKGFIMKAGKDYIKKILGVELPDDGRKWS